MAYGSNYPFGLQPRWNLQSGPYTGQLSGYLIKSGYASSIFTGDPVRLLGDGTIGVDASGLPMCGVFFGVKYTDTNRNYVYSPFWPSAQALLPNTFAQALIVDAPDTLFDVQCSNSNPASTTAATLQLGAKQTDLNQNANFAIGGNAFTDAPAIVPQNPASGSAVSGQSGFYLDLSTLNQPAGGNLKIIRLTPRPENAFYTANGGVGVGTGNFNNVVVSLNNDSFKGGTGTSVVGAHYVASGVLTPAEVIAMTAAPRLLIHPFGAGSIIVVNSFSIQTTAGGTAYGDGSAIVVRYQTTGTTVLANNMTATVLTGAQPQSEFESGVANTPRAAAEFGKGIEITTAGGAFSGGANNNVRWTLEYSVIAV